MLTDFFFCCHTGVEAYLQNNKYVNNQGSNQLLRLNDQRKEQGTAQGKSKELPPAEPEQKEQDKKINLND